MKIVLKNFRQAHNLYQSEIAEILGINQSNVSRAELKGYLELTYPQEKALIEKFGKEDVESFLYEEDGENVIVEAKGNVNEGGGSQNNGYIGADKTALNIIKQQSEALANLAAKQAEQTDKMISLLEKISERL